MPTKAHGQAMDLTDDALLDEMRVLALRMAGMDQDAPMPNRLAAELLNAMYLQSKAWRETAHEILKRNADVNLRGFHQARRFNRAD